MDVLSVLINRHFAWTTEEERYSFPTTLKQGMTFHEFKEIRQLLELEAKERNLPFDQEHYALFKWGGESQSQYARFRCRICSCEINILRRDQLLVMGDINTEHIHGPEQAQNLRRKLTKLRLK